MTAQNNITRTLDDVLASVRKGVPEVGSAENARRTAIHEARRRAERERELLERADLRGVPTHARVRGCALRDALEGPCVDAVRAMLKWQQTNAVLVGGGAVLCLSGDPGCGKTVALAWAATHYEPPPLARRPTGAAPGRAAKFCYAHDLVRLARAQFGAEAEAARELASARLLCVDEAGVEADPNALAELLVRRVDAGYPTILATNLTRAQLDARYFADGTGAGRLQSRLAAQQLEGLPWLFECNDGDRRLGL